MANNISLSRITWIDATQNVADVVIYGNPSLSPGLNYAVGSVATQLDSNPPGLRWAKTGTGLTAWVLAFLDPNTNKIQLGNLPGATYAPVQRRDIDMANNELLAASAKDNAQGIDGFLDGSVTLQDGDTCDAIWKLKAGVNT